MFGLKLTNFVGLISILINNCHHFAFIELNEEKTSLKVNDSLHHRRTTKK